ncbi:hypothetical protein ABVK25_010642 [Lepraria finkii]|uniref:Uncharacterized protein n=1 Tax=Lepraria finkii TaxID=1340010 RepID=A0ABR4ATU7_9LECA
MWLGYTCGLLKNNTVVTVFPDQPTFIITATPSTSKSTSRTTRLTTTTSSPTSSTTILTTTTTTGVSADANPLSVPFPSAFLSALSVVSALSIAAESILLPKPAASSSANKTPPSSLVSPSVSS